MNLLSAVFGHFRQGHEIFYSITLILEKKARIVRIFIQEKKIMPVSETACTRRTDDGRTDIGRHMHPEPHFQRINEKTGQNLANSYQIKTNVSN